MSVQESFLQMKTNYEKCSKFFLLLKSYIPVVKVKTHSWSGVGEGNMATT